MASIDKKIRIAFIKFAGLSAGGTERWLQMMAANLPKDQFEIDYYYCDAAPYTNSSYKHADTNEDRKKYMELHGVKLIKFSVKEKDITKPNHPWIGTNFWELFDPKKYDFVQTAKAGPREYPYYLLPLPVVEFISLDAGVDYSTNIIWSIHLSNYQRDRWVVKGGSKKTSSVIYIPVESPTSSENLRQSLGIPDTAIVAGFHQRNDDEIASDIPLAAFKHLENANRYFVVMGGGQSYRTQAHMLGIKNIRFIEHSADPLLLSKFLNTLNIFAHGRKDGETFGAVLAEAMIHGLPCLSHRSTVANAQPETMAAGGLFAHDESEYRQMLLSLFTEEPLRKKLGLAALSHARTHYTIAATVDQLAVLYQELASQKEKTALGNMLYKKTRAFLHYSTSLTARIVRAVISPLKSTRRLLKQ